MPDYFEKLRVEGQKLDEGINKLTEIWNAPHIHIGRSYTRYAENSENLEEAGKANAAAEALSKFVAELNESVNEDLDKSNQSLTEMQQFREKSWSIYEDIKLQCDDIEVLFTENGYLPENDESINGVDKLDLTTVSKHSEQPEVIFTPYYLSWKSKMKAFDASTPELKENSMKKKMKELPKDTVNDLETSLDQKLRINHVNYTPHRQSPQELILSRHYYELVQKKRII